MTVEEVKEELRKLRHAQKRIKINSEALRRHEDMLTKCEAKDREALEGIISALKESISEAAELEKRYLKMLEVLSEDDRALLIDAFVNVTPYYKVGMKYGYSEAGVYKRLQNIYRKIAQGKNE